MKKVVTTKIVNGQVVDLRECAQIITDNMGFSQAKVGELLGWSQPTVHKYKKELRVEQELARRDRRIKELEDNMINNEKKSIL